MKIQRLRAFQIFTFLLGLVTLIAIVIGSSREITALPYAAHDDGLFVTLAMNLFQGKWLGEYNQYTLIKGPFYPIFLAVNYVLGFPLLITKQVFYCFSGIALIYAISFFIQSYRYLLLIYVVYIFNPIAYYIARVLRDGVYISLTTLVIAGAILMAAHLSGNYARKHKILHSSFFGISFACFWLTREEGVWLLPSVALIIGASVFSLLKQRRSYKVTIQQLGQTLLPAILCFLGCFLCASLLNYSHYGVFIARSELVTKEFQDAYGALLRVKESEWNPFIPVSREVRQKLYATSEKFGELRSHLEQQSVIDGWSSAGGCEVYPSTCGDYAGGWFVWAFRDAVAAAGYYDSAPHAFAFYRDLATEVNRLCDQKRLECEPRKSGIMPSLNAYYLGQASAAFIRGLEMVTSLSDLSIPESQAPSAGDPAGLALFQEATHNPIISPNTKNRCRNNHLEVVGWLNAAEYSIRLRKPSEGPIQQSQLSSPDLVTAFNDQSLKNSRFKLDVCCKTCMISLVKQDKEIFQINLLQGISSGTGPNGLRYNLELVQEVEQGNITIGRIKLEALERINVIFYQHLLFWLNLIAISIWLVRLIAFKYISGSPIYWIATSCLVAVVARVVILSLIDVTSFPAVYYQYLAPCLPLLPMFALLISIDTFNSLKRPSGYWLSNVAARIAVKLR